MEPSFWQENGDWISAAITMVVAVGIALVVDRLVIGRGARVAGRVSEAGISGSVGGRTPDQAHMHLITKPVKPKRSPVINIRLADERYSSWKQFLDTAYWTVELK